MVSILMISAKMATPGLLKIKDFLKKLMTSWFPLFLRGSLGSSSITLNRVKVNTKSDLVGAFQLFFKNTVKARIRFWKSCLRNKYTCDAITIFICIISSRTWRLLLKQFCQSCALFPLKFFDRSILYPK